MSVPSTLLAYLHTGKLVKNFPYKVFYGGGGEGLSRIIGSVPGIDTTVGQYLIGPQPALVRWRQVEDLDKTLNLCGNSRRCGPCGRSFNDVDEALVFPVDGQVLAVFPPPKDHYRHSVVILYVLL